MAAEPHRPATRRGHLSSLPANPYAYLHGVGVEVMENSGQRALRRKWLTPSTSDVPELLRVLDFTPAATRILPRAIRDGAELIYDTPGPESCGVGAAGVVEDQVGREVDAPADEMPRPWRCCCATEGNEQVHCRRCRGDPGARRRLGAPLMTGPSGCAPPHRAPGFSGSPSASWPGVMASPSSTRASNVHGDPLYRPRALGA